MTAVDSTYLVIGADTIASHVGGVYHIGWGWLFVAVFLAYLALSSLAAILASKGSA